MFFLIFEQMSFLGESITDCTMRSVVFASVFFGTGFVITTSSKILWTFTT